MFDVGAACQTFCLAAHDAGLGTVIMGIWDEDGITDLLQIPEDQELAALIAIGHPDIDPDTPKRKSVSDLLTLFNKTGGFYMKHLLSPLDFFRRRTGQPDGYCERH